MKPFSIFIITILTFHALVTITSAQDIELETTVGSGIVLEIGSGFSRVALADETIAKVTVLDGGELLIHGRSNGRTTLFVWTTDMGRKTYNLRVNRDLEALVSAVATIEGEIAIEESTDSRTLLLKGEVATKENADTAGKRIQEVLETLPEPRPGLVNLLTFPEPDDPVIAVDGELLAALNAIDERISLRRIRVDEITSEARIPRDSYVLEGAVKNIRALTKAIYIADRQLGGTGGLIQAADVTKIRTQRRRQFNQNFLGSGGSSGGGQALSGGELIPNGLAAQIARGLILSSESGRVISFLEVDLIEQIMVSIRVLEIDRKKARSLGINYRIDASKLSVGSLNVPHNTQFPVLGADAVNALGSQGGNLVGSYVSSTTALMAAIDVLQERAVARSVAEPNVLTLTGEEASVMVGGEVPIPSTAIGNVSSVQGFDFQSFGVRLDIRPTITEDGRVTLEVAPSIVQPSLDLGNGDVPGFEVQTVQTTARVPEGNSLLLGGLLTFEEGVEERGIPILSRIPLVGYLFKWKKNIRDEKELMFIMTPRVIDEKETQVIPELPSLESRNRRIGEELEPQKLERDGVPELWRNPEPDYPPDLWPHGPDHKEPGKPLPSHLKATDPMPTRSAPVAAPKAAPEPVPTPSVAPQPEKAPAPAPTSRSTLDPNAPMPLRAPSKKKLAQQKVERQPIVGFDYPIHIEKTYREDGKYIDYRAGFYPLGFQVSFDRHAIREGNLSPAEKKRLRYMAQQLKRAMAIPGQEQAQLAKIDLPSGE